MSMKYIRKTYNVPAKRGMRVEVYYHPRGWGRLPENDPGRWKLAYRGRITSASNVLHIDGVPFHPSYGIVYFDKDGSVLLDTRNRDY